MEEENGRDLRLTAGGFAENVGSKLLGGHLVRHQFGQTTYSCGGNSPLFPGENRLAADSEGACRSTDTTSPMYRFFDMVIGC